MKAGEIAAATDKWHGTCADMPLTEAAASCRWLSGLCDGARANDGAGWSRFDHEAGLRLGMLPDAGWSDGDLSMGRHLSHKYRKQLALRPPLEELGAKRRKLFAAQPSASQPAPAVAPPPPASEDPFARIEATDGKPCTTIRFPAKTVPTHVKGTVTFAKPPASEAPQQGRHEKRLATPLGESPGDGPFAAASGIQLDDSQRAALDLIARSPVAILTGGPGTGKTTITQQVVRDALRDSLKVAAMAPTGIAAKRLSEAIAYPATTIHRALGAIPQGEGLLVVQPEQRDATARADVVIVDEMSMVTSQLFAALLRAVKPGAQLLLIGDADQLAPVGSGQPLFDFIASGLVPVAQLTTVHRQAEGSRILEACDLVRRGKWYDAAPQASRSDDLAWLEEDSEERLADLCEEVLVQARAKYSAAEITLLTPRVTGGTADNVVLRTEELNRRLQRRLNPAAAGQLGGICEGDPIICGRNRPADGVWNGTSGTAEMVADKLMLRVHDAEQRLVDCVEDCELAYCISVHRYQGSQNRVIILAAHPSGGKTLTRRLLYTAISRAQERCILLGPRAAFESAAQTAPTRKTLLRDILTSSSLYDRASLKPESSPDGHQAPHAFPDRLETPSPTIPERRATEADQRAMAMAGPGLRARMNERRNA